MTEPTVYPAPAQKCQTCVHSTFFRGSPGSREEPPEPDYWMCEHPDPSVSERQENDDTALTCTSYTPRMVEACGQCGTVINVPEIAHGMWVMTVWELMPVCSKACAAKAEQETMDYYSEEARAERAAEQQRSMWEIHIDMWED